MSGGHVLDLVMDEGRVEIVATPGSPSTPRWNRAVPIPPRRRVRSRRWRARRADRTAVTASTHNRSGSNPTEFVPLPGQIAIRPEKL